MGNIFSQSVIDFFFQVDELLLENIYKFRYQILAETLRKEEKERIAGDAGCSVEELKKYNKILEDKMIFYAFQIMIV